MKRVWSLERLEIDWRRIGFGRGPPRFVAVAADAAARSVEEEVLVAVAGHRAAGPRNVNLFNPSLNSLLTMKTAILGQFILFTRRQGWWCRGRGRGRHDIFWGYRRSGGISAVILDLWGDPHQVYEGRSHDDPLPSWNLQVFLAVLWTRCHFDKLFPWTFWVFVLFQKVYHFKHVLMLKCLHPVIYYNHWISTPKGNGQQCYYPMTTYWCTK